jgi:hypothetical protein
MSRWIPKHQDIGAILSQYDVDKDTSKAWGSLYQEFIVREWFDPPLKSFLPIEVKNVILLFWASGQIGNGGVDQYFTNSYGKYAEDTLIAYKTIGAEKLAIALAVAMASFPEGKYPKDDKEFFDIIENLPDHRIIFPQNIDDTFYSEDIAPRIIEYIREHFVKFAP